MAPRLGISVAAPVSESSSLSRTPSLLKVIGPPRGSDAVCVSCGRAARPNGAVESCAVAFVGEFGGEVIRLSGAGDLDRLGDWPNNLRGAGDRARLDGGGGERGPVRLAGPGEWMRVVGGGGDL